MAIRPEMLGRLLNEHAPALELYARQWTDAAEDVVQEAFVALARQRKVPDSVRPWLFRVVRNGAISAARRARRRLRHEARASVDESWFTATDDRIDAQRASQLLAEIDADAREVIVARIWGGLTLDEVARVVGCSTTTAHRRYHAGLAQLLERLERPWTCLNAIPDKT